LTARAISPEHRTIDRQGGSDDPDRILGNFCNCGCSRRQLTRSGFSGLVHSRMPDFAVACSNPARPDAITACKCREAATVYGSKLWRGSRVAASARESGKDEAVSLLRSSSGQRLSFVSIAGAIFQLRLIPLPQCHCWPKNRNGPLLPRHHRLRHMRRWLRHRTGLRMRLAGPK
jgi:hypothetical protein